MLHGGRAPAEVIVLPQVPAGSGRLEIAKRLGTGLVEPLLHALEIAHPRRMRQIVRHRPDPCE